MIQKKTINEIVVDIASRRKDFLDLIRHDNYFWLLRLLEFPFEAAIKEIRPAFENAGLIDEYELVSLQRLVGFALNMDGSGYWGELAADWLEKGVPPDAALALEIENMIKNKRSTQSARHKAFRAIGKWEKSQQRS